MSLIKRLFLVSELHTTYAKMALAADFGSPRSSDQRRSGRLLARPHMRVLHAFASTSESLTRQTDSDFHYRCSFFPLGENTRLDTHTQHNSCDDRRTPPSTSAFVFGTLQSFQRSTLFSRGLFKASCFPTVSPTTQASPE